MAVVIFLFFFFFFLMIRRPPRSTLFPTRRSSDLRKAYQVPFVGTVPAIKPACARSKTKRVSVLGTKGTVQREYTRTLIRDFAQGCEVTLVGSPELASLAEAALSGHAIADGDILAELTPCFVGDAK